MIYWILQIGVPLFFIFMGFVGVRGDEGMGIFTAIVIALLVLMASHALPVEHKDVRVPPDQYQVIKTKNSVHFITDSGISGKRMNIELYNNATDTSFVDVYELRKYNRWGGHVETILKIKYDN